MSQKYLFFPSQFKICFLYKKSSKKILSFLFVKSLFVKVFLINFFFIKYYIKNFYLLFISNIQKKKNITNLFYFKNLLILQQIIIPIRVKLQLYGIGYCFFLKKNILLCNVGGSYFMEYKLNKNFLYYILGKKKNILLLKSISLVQLKQISINIINLRYPNIYTGKGIFFYKKKYFTKIGKLKKNN
jgi:hypothetical protein